MKVHKEIKEEEFKNSNKKEIKKTKEKINKE